MTGHPYPLDYVNRIVSCNITEGRYRLITVKHEIPGQSVVIPGSLDRPSKLVKSLDCPGQPWTVGNYATSAQNSYSQLSEIKIKSLQPPLLADSDAVCVKPRPAPLLTGSKRSDHDVKLKSSHIKLICIQIIGASLSEPHTRELGGEISVCVLACLLACLQSFRNRLFRVTFIFAMTSFPGALWPCKEAQDGV